MRNGVLTRLLVTGPEKGWMTELDQEETQWWLLELLGKAPWSTYIPKSISSAHLCRLKSQKGEILSSQTSHCNSSFQKKEPEMKFKWIRECLTSSTISDAFIPSISIQSSKLHIFRLLLVMITISVFFSSKGNYHSLMNCKC